MRKFYRCTAAGIMSLALALNAAGYTPAPKADAAGNGITINEVCPKNTVTPAPDGGLYDWVELYNSSSSSMDISGWGLTDKASKPYRYTFPSGTVIGAGQRLTVFCDADAGAANASIVPFGLSTSGETLTLTDASGTTVSTVTFEAMASDTSYGQYPDGSGDYFVLSCTPNSANTAPEGSNAVKTPEFSAESGFYDNEFQLNISAPSGTTVYYTIDGSDPTSASERYTSGIRIYDRTNEPNVYSANTDISASKVAAPTKPVDKAMVVRAVAVDSQGRTSNIVTKTYFVGTTNGSYYKDMKVVSLVTDPDNLFDYEKGIYVKGKIFDEKNQTQQNPGGPGGQGGPGGWGGIGGWGDFGGFGWGMVNPWEMEANYTQHGKEWERPASFELFENGKSILSQGVGIRIKGAASRSSAQKSFNVYARADYGKAELEYDFFDGTSTKKKNGKTVKKYEGITIRNGGNDCSYAFFRDSINQNLVADRNMAVEATNQCMVFIDGEFWGIYQIIERVSDDYISSHYDIKKSDVAIIKNFELEEGSDQDLNDWNNLVKSCYETDMTNEQNYRQLCEKLDIQSYIDYFAAQIYWNNTDWPQNNFASWRSNAIDDTNPYADGKWRMFLFDTEYSTGLYGNGTTADANTFQRVLSSQANEGKMFAALMKNNEFKAQFERTMMDLYNYNFTQEKTEKVIKYYSENFRQQILDTFERFYSDSYSGQKGVQQLEKEYRAVTDFYQSRGSYIQRQMKNALSLTGELKTVNISQDTNKGKVRVNTVTLGKDYSTWSGQYYSDYDITVSALPENGYTFDHWEVSGADLSGQQLKSKELTVKLNSDVTLTPVYTAESSTDKGDYNNDGSINIADAVVLQQYLLGKKVQINFADMNNDGSLDSYDLVLLRRALIKNK